MNPYSFEPGSNASLKPDPVAEAAFNPDGNSLDAGRASAWYGQAFAMFKLAPGIWIGIILILFVLLLVMALIPILGQAASNLLFPVVMGGLMMGCHALYQGRELKIDHLFAGFQDKFGPLALLGLFYLIATFLVLMMMGIVVAIFAGGAIFAGIMSGSGSLLAGLGIGAIFAIVVLFFVPFLLIGMAIWSAPCLVVFHNVAPFDALMMSLKANLKNWATFLIFTLLYIVLAIAATIPLGLGWLVLGPMLVAACYFSYRDTFLR